MRKKNTLYTANKWNQPLFAKTVDGSSRNIYDTGGPFQVDLSLSDYAPDKGINSPSFTSSFGYQPNLTVPKRLDLSHGAALGVQQALNPLPKLGTSDSSTSPKMGNAARAALSVGSNLVSGLAYKGISGGLNSPMGSIASSLGSTAGNIVGMANPVLGAAITAASGVIGGLTNAAFGSKLNEENIAAVNNTVSGMRDAAHAMGKSRTSTDILNQWGSIDMGSDFDNSYIGKDGWFSSKAKKEAERLRNKQNIARMVASHALATTADNVDAATDDIAAQNVKYAFGGFLGDTSDMGAIDYGFMSDYLSMKDKQADKSKITGMTQMPAFMNGFALGGDLQTHGADWTNGATHIDAGGSHEENKYQGVQLGTDQEGTPNLVEEGECIFNDYVYSKRILADEDTKKQFRLPRKKDISYADIAKRLTKESAERPNDPISQAALQMQMNKLAEQQERQKAEMQEAQAQEAFASLSPEEKQALLMEAAARRQQGAEEQQMAEQAMQEQAMGEQGVQEPSPEEIAMAQQQMMADGSELSLEPEPEGYAYGGKVNKFETGGDTIKRAIYNALGYYTDDAFDKWAKSNNLTTDDWDWENALENAAFIEALGKINPALAHAIKTGHYDFGAFKPEKSDKATIQSIAAGNWKNTNGKGWRTTGSTDDAYLQAVEGLTDAEIDALTTEELAEKMKGTKAYQDTSKWLQNADNALLYLNTLLNDKDTPEVAKEYARKYVTDGKWKDGFTYDYGKVFGKDGKGVRETNPGTYWHSVKEASRGENVKNFLIGADGSIQEIVVDVPKDWETANTYKWQDKDSDWTYNYYRDPKAPKVGDADVEDGKKKIDLKDYEPILKKEWPRFAGMLGPAVGLGMQALGVGKPNTAGLDAAVNLVGKSGARASYQPIPDYLRVQPMDMWSVQNKMDANSRATDRSILNSGNMFGARVAGLLANNQNNIEENGNLYRKGLEYNAGDRRTAADFNRGTNTFNADAYNKVSLANAELASGADRAKATLAMQAAQAKMNADAAWNQGIYGNVSGLFKGIGELGRENAQHNMLARMASSGIFGTAEPENAVFAGLIKRKNSAKKGGKINKRKRKGGLTI